jgi:hypothetical protein
MLRLKPKHVLFFLLMGLASVPLLAQKAVCLTDSCCRRILFSHYDQSRSEELNVFADPLDTTLRITRMKTGIEIRYVEHTLKGSMKSKTSSDPAKINYYFSIIRKMKLKSDGSLEKITSIDTLFHLYSSRYGMGNDSSVNTMGKEHLHSYKAGSVLLYDKPGGKVLDSIREAGLKLKGSIECSVYEKRSEAEMEITEYKCVRYKGRYFWAKGNWLRTIYLKPGTKKWNQEQYMLSWLIED